MANRIIPIETKVNALNKCLALQNVEAVADILGVAPNSIRYWFETKVLANLPEVLEKEQPGPKVKAAPVAMRPAEGKRAASIRKVDEGPDHCPDCQSVRVWKNGLYWVINWLVFLSLHWFSQSHVAIQRYCCGDCGREIASPQRQRLVQARRQGWQFFKRFVAFSKFKLGKNNWN